MTTPGDRQLASVPPKGVQGGLSIEEPNVLRLCPAQAADRPGQMHEVGLERWMERVHPAFFGKPVSLPGVATATGRDDVGPGVPPPTRNRHEMVAREALARTQLGLGPVAELAPVLIAGKEEGIGDVTAEAAGDVHELDEPDDGWPWNGQPFTSHVFRAVGLDDFGLALNDKPQRPAHGHHGQWLE